MKRQVCLLGLLFGLGACHTDRVAPRVGIESELRERCPTLAADANIEVRSSCSPECTAVYAAMAREEAAFARRALGAPALPAVRLYLVGIDADAPAWDPVGVGGYEGLASPDGCVVVYVPRDERNAAVRAFTRSGTLRHELLHAYSVRVGLRGPKWLNEGLACELAEGREVHGEWRASLYPSALLGARTSVSRGTIARLLAWRSNEGIGPAERKRLYAESQALFRFLMLRVPGARAADRIRAVARTGEGELVGYEAGWLAWLGGLDALAAIRAGLASGEGTERSEAAALLPALAEEGAGELSQREADELALDALADPLTDAEAARFLVYFRAGSLRETDVERLARSRSPVERLVAYALRARRGEPLDLEAAQATLAALDGNARTRLMVVAHVIPGLSGF
jgi:hypothetical protein